MAYKKNTDFKYNVPKIRVFDCRLHYPIFAFLKAKETVVPLLTS